MRLNRFGLVVVVGGLLVGVPVASAAGPTWVTPVASLTAAGATPTGGVQLASNARGDTAVAWIDQSTGDVFESDRPAGGSFGQATAVSGAAGQQLGSIALDNSGAVYVFFATNTGTAAQTVPNVATRQVGSSASWTLTPLAAASASDPPQTPIGAVTPSGRAIAVWDQGHTAGNEDSKFEFATKPAGSATWSAKLDVTGAGGGGSATAIPSAPALAIDSAGDAAFVFERFDTNFDHHIVFGETLPAGTTTWTTPDAISGNVTGDDIRSSLAVAMDPTGTATVAWSRHNGANDIVQFATKTLAATSWPAAPAGTSSTLGANDLSPLGSDADETTIGVEPDGTTTIAWVRNGAMEERTRAVGASSFAPATTIPTTLMTPTAPSLVANPSGGMVALFTGMSSGQSAIGAASRASGASTFTTLPSVPGTANAQPVFGVDDQGNVPAAWINTTSGPAKVQATGLDVGAPTISDVAFPATATAGAPLAYSATATDRWSPVTASWAFGDGATGPLTGTHTYSTPGSFLATLTATDAFGHSAGATQAVQVSPAPVIAPPGPTAAPAITGLRLSPATFAAASGGPTLAAAAGTSIRYTISQASKTTFTVTRRVPGVRKGKGCVAPPRHKGKTKLRSCQRLVAVGSFSHTDAAGAVSLHFSGRIKGHKLAPGGYELTAVGSDSRGKGKAATASFHVVKR